jgi:P22 coat protein - gene protein 5
MPNALLTPQMVTNELLRRFKNNLGFSGAVAHTWDDKFAIEGAKIGDTLKLRDPVRFTAVDGPDITAQIQDVIETSKTLTLNYQKTVAFSFTSKDLTLSIDNFRQRYLDSAALALANSVDVVGLTLAYQATSNIVGTPGTAPTDMKPFWAAGEALDTNAAPFDGERTIVYSPSMNSTVLDLTKGLFQSSTQIKNQYEKGRMGTMGGFEWVMDQNVRTHTVGPLGGAPAVNQPNQTGATLNVTGFTAAAAARLKKGDAFTIINVYDVNPVSGDVSSKLQQFTVTADVSSAADGSAAIPIDPPIIATGASRTVSASPAGGAALTIISGTANQLSPQNLAFHRDAFVLGMAPLEVPKNTQFGANQQDPDTGCAIRMVSQYDILKDLFVTRADVLFGYGAQRPEWSCRIVS